MNSGQTWTSCQRCQAIVPLDYRFCPECGRRLSIRSALLLALIDISNVIGRIAGAACLIGLALWVLSAALLR